MKQYKYLELLTYIAITIYLVTNVTSSKIIQLGPFFVSVVVLYWPFSYVLGDIFTEVYGYGVGRRVIWRTMLCAAIAGIIYFLVARIPVAPGSDLGDYAAFFRVLGAVPRTIIAGFVTYFVGNFLNDYTLAKMKILTKGRWLWTRTIGSTIVAQAGETLVFYPLAFYGILPLNLMLAAMLGGWIIKVGVEIIFTPITYWIVGKLKKIENEDYYDYHTNFNPFIIKER